MCCMEKKHIMTITDTANMHQFVGKEGITKNDK